MSGEEDPAAPTVGRSEFDVDVDVVVGPVPPTSSSRSPGGRAGRSPDRRVGPAPATPPTDRDDVAVGETSGKSDDDGGGEDAAPRAPRPSSPRSHRTVPSLLSALAIEDAAAAAAATAVVLLRGRGRGVAHMMHASPRSFSFTMVQAPHSHDDDMLF